MLVDFRFCIYKNKTIMFKIITSLTVTVMIMLATQLANAQSPAPNNHSKNRNVLSINPASTISSIWYPISTQDHEYIAIYHRIIGKANGIRLGVNGNSRSYLTNEFDTLASQSSNKAIKLGIGYERYFYLSKAWSYFVGVDAQLQSSKNIYQNKNSTQFKQQSNTNTNGAYLFFGALVNVNAKLSISISNGVKYADGNTTTDSKRLINGVWKDEPSDNKISTIDYVNPTLQLRMRF
jgi:hypothetical protein